MINFVPPRFLDDYSLLEEYQYTGNLFKEIERFHLTGIGSKVPFRSQHAFIFLRHEMLENELELRKLKYKSVHLDPNDITESNDTFPLTSAAVTRTSERLVLRWQRSLNLVEDGEIIERLVLVSPSDILLELEWLFDLYRREYDL